MNVRRSTVIAAAALVMGSPGIALAEGWGDAPRRSHDSRPEAQQWPDRDDEPLRPSGQPSESASGSSAVGSPQTDTPGGTAAEPVTIPASAVSSQAATTCSLDAGLPLPVVATVVDTVDTVEDTVTGTAGPLPADVSGTVASTAGCTDSSGGTDPEPTDPGTGSGAEPTVEPVDAVGLPEATAAPAVDATPRFAG